MGFLDQVEIIPNYWISNKSTYIVNLKNGYIEFYNSEGKFSIGELLNSPTGQKMLERLGINICEL